MDFAEAFTFIRQLIAILAIITGTTFSILGVLGFIRLPDVYALACHREGGRVWGRPADHCRR